MDRFFAYLEAHGLPKISELTPLYVSGFINTFVAYSYKSNELYLCILRALLKFFYIKGFMQENLVISMPKIKCRKYYRIPQVWNKNDIVKLLNEVDRDSQVGKRDYAIILLIIRLGIRSVDVRNLKFDHINWQEEQIEFTQSKTGNKNILPLLHDVGWAIIDYLKNSRPNVSSPYIFLTLKSPFEPFSDSNFYGILKKYISSSGIKFEDNQEHGMHSLRHYVERNKMVSGRKTSAI